MILRERVLSMLRASARGRKQIVRWHPLNIIINKVVQIILLLLRARENLVPPSLIWARNREK